MNNKEHPKNLIEVMSNTLDSVTGYASAKKMSYEEAALILILNELRCIHWHMDTLHEKTHKPEKE